jgi:hypothetical protein
VERLIEDNEPNVIETADIVAVRGGLEKVQDEVARGCVFGELQDGPLSDLLVRVAEGYLPALSVLITSRFPLAELDERGSVYYRPIAVEEIEPAAAVALSRQRGVRGTDDQLRSIAAECGHHALTVDLAGGFITEFGGGDPATPLRLTRFDDEQARRAEPTNDRRRHVRLHEYVTMGVCDGKDGSVSTLVLSPYTLLRVEPDQLN